MSEAAEAKYLPRLLFVYFQRGMAKAYKYEFLDLKPDPEFTDMERHFGLVRVDGTPKPSFHALANLIQLLADPGPTFTPGSLEWQLKDTPANLQHLLLQKRDGRFWLVLFQEAVSFDAKAHRDLSVSAAGVTLALGRPAASVRVFRPGQSVEPLLSREAISELKLDVPDEVMLVEIRPSS